MIQIIKNLIKYYKFKSKKIICEYNSVNRININSKIGKYTKIGRNTTIYKDVKIGEYNFINVDNKFYSGNIGRFCSFGPANIIGPEEHPVDRLMTHHIMYKSNENYTDIKVKEIIEFKQEDAPIIQDNVWISSNCIILRGVVIGEGSIIGANSVVSNDIPPYSVAVGSPAKVIYNRKERFNLKDINMKDLDTSEIISYIENGTIV